MRRLSVLISILFLSFSAVSLMKPQQVAAAEGGPAGTHMLRAVAGPNLGEVTLSWNDALAVDNYHLVYGTSSKNMQYGLLNIGNVKTYTVKMLAPGTKYYFAIVPVRDNVALYTSEWVSAQPSGGVVKQVTPVTSAEPVKAVTKITPVTTTSAVITAGPAGKHRLVANTGPKSGEVTLTWRHVDDANNYHLVYGTEPGKYKYGQLNIGWVTSYTVRRLVAGKAYYFALVPVKNDVALYTSDQVMTAAYRPVQVVTTTPEAVTQSKPTVKGGRTYVPLPGSPAGQ